jgi:hypothetical protein
MVVETIIPLFRALYSATGYAESEQSWMRWRGVRGNKCSGVPEGILRDSISRWHTSSRDNSLSDFSYPWKTN